MIANLMMYARPELDDAHNNYWASIRQHLAKVGIDSPETLSQDAEEFAVWNDPELVLSQTCGMPYRTLLHGKVTLIGTPDFGIDDCPAGYYRSAIITRANDPRKTLPEFKDACFAYNQTFSQSGYAAPYWHLKPHGFWFQNQLQVHQHIEAARAVTKGRADIAAIDAVTWRLLRKYEGFADKLQVLEWTKPTPALPYIAALGVAPEPTFNAVVNAITDLSDEDRALLGLKQIVYIPPEAYLAIENPNHPS
jgi:ABC-type phosphate/phosphonate transport system substrate-binding protein